MAYDAFISHAVRDQMATDEVYDYLQENGINCFMDKKSLIPGKLFPDKIVEAIAESPIVVLVFSKAADASDPVMNEMAIASRNKRPIIPLRIENVEPKRLALYLSAPQWCDAFPPPLNHHLPKLLVAVRHHLGNGGAKQPSPPNAPPPPPPVAPLITHHDWIDVDAPPGWIMKDRKLLKELNSGKVIAGKTFVYRFNKDTGRYQKKLK